MIRRKWPVLLMALLCMSVAMSSAQEEAPESETAEAPVVPYFQSSSRFNVPVLAGWQNQGNADTADYVNPDLSARIVVSTLASDDASASIENLISEVQGEAFSTEARYEDSLNLNDGTWIQRLYDTESAQISAMAKVREGMTDVVLLISEDPERELYSVVLRNADLMGAESALAVEDPLPAMQAAAAMLFNVPADAEPESTEDFSLISGVWQRAIFDGADETIISVDGLIFGNATYMLVSQGNSAPDIALADAINAVFLGFFITPDNSIYLYGGLIASAVVMLVLLGSFYVRRRNALRDLALIETLEED